MVGTASSRFTAEDQQRENHLKRNDLSQKYRSSVKVVAGAQNCREYLNSGPDIAVCHSCVGRYHQYKGIIRTLSVAK